MSRIILSLLVSEAVQKVSPLASSNISQGLTNELFKFILIFISFRRGKVLTSDLKSLKALNAPLLRFFKGKVCLPQEDINRNSEVVNSVLSSILEKISKQDEIFSLKKLNTGKFKSLFERFP